MSSLASLAVPSRSFPEAAPTTAVPVRDIRVAASRPHDRKLRRRPVYLGEGLSVTLRVGSDALAGEIVDLTPEGIGVALLDGQAPSVGARVTVEHTGRALAGVTQRAVVAHVTDGIFGGRRLVKIGLCFAREGKGGPTKNRRTGERYACPASFPVMVSAQSPIFFREWLHFRVAEISAGGLTLATSIRNKNVVPGMELEVTVMLPVAGALSARLRIASISCEAGDDELRVGAAWVGASRQLLEAMSEYLLLGHKDLSPSRLRAGGFSVGSVEHAITYDYASSASDYDDVLGLRLRAHQAEGRLLNASKRDMVSRYDEHSRHLAGRFGGRVVAYLRLIYVEGDKERSQYVSEGGHEIPDWLWKAGFVEGGAGATDPEFQRAGIYLSLMQHAVRVAMQSGHRFLLGACGDDVLPMYQSMGFSILETRTVEPKPGWSFRSHLILLDMEQLVETPPQGKCVPAIVSAAEFAGRPAARVDAAL